MADKDFFDEFDLKVVSVQTVDIGSSYPIYGMITAIISHQLDNVIIEINYGQIEATMNVTDAESLNIIKSKAFEPGIFICRIQDNKHPIKAHCSTAIFGRTTQEFEN